MTDDPRPQHLDLDRRRGLTIHWDDGRVSFYPVGYLRRMSPSAEMRELRDQMERNPLTVLPQSMAGASSEDLQASDAELVGNYALRIHFSDGHHTGLFSWDYLRRIDPDRPAEAQDPPPES